MSKSRFDVLLKEVQRTDQYVIDPETELALICRAN
jgi:hypothetical protein